MCPGAVSNGRIRRFWGWQRRLEDVLPARAVCYRFSCVYWFPTDIFGGRAGGAVGVSTLVGWIGLFTGDGGGTRAESRWTIALGVAGGLSIGAGWVFCSGVEYVRIGCRGLDMKMARMRVRDSKRLVCSVAVISLMLHNRKWSA